MSIQLQGSQGIDRPLAKVFHFSAEEHVRNHFRRESDIQLEQISDGPIEIGTVSRRRNCRSETSVEGTMEVVEFERNRAIGMNIQDSPAEMCGRTTFEAAGDDQTILTTTIELPGMDESMDTSFLMDQLVRGGKNMKQLIESEMVHIR